MAYRTGDRQQLGLLPESIEDYVSPEDPVRAYDAFVEALNLPQLGIEVDPNQVGNAAYDPRVMLKSSGLRLLLRGAQLPEARAGVPPQPGLCVADGGAEARPQDHCGVPA